MSSIGLFIEYIYSIYIIIIYIITYIYYIGFKMSYVRYSDSYSKITISRITGSVYHGKALDSSLRLTIDSLLKVQQTCQ
ncbi:hypothetical protein MBAV_003352 [Candidatus Magnetobacterium bavaricum]|uniref:Uncharacterized protein n=1 Tax=Candidatus Magnetobacterium bavaricum TaxID=29290 RepID=A0A0F3GR72_9BACT|nr:hypothetical protein MBAV_003352 [Candidatus Magnetobacterium bavaricum]